MQRILDVIDVKIAFEPGDQSHIVIYAEGKVTTTGWTLPALGAWAYIDTPADGIQDFDFTAEPPSGIAGMVISPISVSLHVPIDIANYWGPGKPLKGVRIHGQKNAVEAPLPDAAEDGVKILGGDASPWPWATFLPKKGSLDEPISSLVGRFSRVYREGDLVTLDLMPQRINIVLKKDSALIQSVWFG